MAEMSKKMVAETEFEKEKSAGLNIDRLSYICDYCGKVNQIGAPRCVRCGKRRPRNEYINAMNKIKTSKTIKAEYLEEQYKVEEEKKSAAQEQIVRLVESRVEDEKRSIIAQENLRVEQEREAIKKSTARDAVLRIIAAERAAEDKIKDAEQRADDIVKGRNKEIEEILEEEKNKIMEVASQKVVAARAGIEEAAREQIEANKKIADKFVSDTLTDEKDKAQKNAARRAVLQIIAAEKAADEKIKMTKDALQQAAVERIIEERILADKEAAARYLAEKQAIERASDERIKAEKEALKKLLEEKHNSYSGYGQQSFNATGASPNAVQPLAIVPYLNSRQPVYQYRPNQVFKFVPKAQAMSVAVKETVASTDNSMVEIKKQKNVGNRTKIRLMSLLSVLVAIAIIALGVIMGNLLPLSSACKNIDIIESIFAMMGITIGMGTSLELSYLITIGFGILLVFTIISLIQSIIRLIAGKSTRFGFIIPLIAFVGAIVAIIGVKEFGLNLIYASLSLLLVIFTIIGGIKSKKDI